MPPFFPAITVLLAGCNLENDLAGKDAGEEGIDTGGDWEPPVDTGDTGDTETCDGADNDGDGEVDEGFPDDDDNGRVDCLDAECPPLDLSAAGEVPVVAACAGGATEPVADPWNAVEKWTFAASSSSPGLAWSATTPVVGNLDDDDGDGDVDEDDSPDVVLNLFDASYGNCLLVALDGPTGTEKWSWPGCDYASGVAIADADADGRPDVIAYASNGAPVALEGDGTLKWAASTVPDGGSPSLPLLTVADLDADGIAEVIADDTVYDGATGAALFALADHAYYHLAAVADVDRDGDPELFLDGSAFDSDGSPLWASGKQNIGGFWTVIVQADGDEQAEIGLLAADWSLWEADGTEVYSRSYGDTPQPGPPCVGDFDGDGAAEVAWGNDQALVMYELDGSPAWTAAMDDTTGQAGCSGFDLDGDGAMEILFGDQTSFRVLDGRTGTTLYEDGSHRSGTVFEYPAVADLDDDGHAEVLVVNNGILGGSAPALVVYAHGGDGWPDAGPTWPVHDYAMTNVHDDGTVPSAPDASWLSHNVYRARVAGTTVASADLTVRIDDVCVADCTYGPVQVAVQVANEGGRDIDAGAMLALYADDDTGLREVATEVLPAVPAGTSLDAVTFELRAADVGAFGFVARVDASGVVDECDEDDNEDRWTDASCP